MYRLLAIATAIFMLLGLPSAWAFDLSELEAQLRARPIVRGKFVQEKFLRSLEHPLTSRGTFVLSAGQGLLWRLHTPIAQSLRITPSGIARQETDGQWRAVPGHAGSSRESRLFMDVLSGDTKGLQDNFDLALSGRSDAWQLTMTPRSALLKQIFSDITIDGDVLVKRIELRETQGDRSVLQMIEAQNTTLDDEERRAFEH